MAGVLAVLEQRDRSLKGVSDEVVTAARALGDQLESPVHAMVIGPSGIDGQQAARFGAEQIIIVEHDDLSYYQGSVYAAAITERARAGAYAVVLLSATAMGKDLAPRVAAQLDCPLVGDATGIDATNGLEVTRPAYSGKALYRIAITKQPCVISVRPNVFTPQENNRSPEIVRQSAPNVTGTDRAKTVAVKESEAGRLDVAEASIVVSGGRGLREPSNFKLLEDLADAIGSTAVGASRAVVDAGWRPHADQVGQTGKTVSPQLYIAVGISGAVQHLAGMRTSKVIVAINKDKDAPIFKVADYGIVGDLFEIVPRLTEEVRKLRGR
jgi:electron transfer flavoprotein alpha subunit